MGDHAGGGVYGGDRAAAGQGGSGDGPAPGTDVEDAGAGRGVGDIDQLPADVGYVEEDLLVVGGDLVVLPSALLRAGHRDRVGAPHRTSYRRWRLFVLGRGVIGDAGCRVPVEVDQRVPRGTLLGVVAPARCGLVGGRLDLPFLFSVHSVPP